MKNARAATPDLSARVHGRTGLERFTFFNMQMSMVSFVWYSDISQVKFKRFANSDLAKQLVK